MINERWKRAQIAEKNHWLSTKEGWSVEPEARFKEIWQGILSHGFGFGYDFFVDKSVLEVGCGPTGIIFQIDTAKSRVGLEPMDLDDLIKDENKKSIVKKGVGEEIPFANDSFDTVISFNALDHSINPMKVIREIYRVLKPGGDFLLWIYVLRNQYQFLQGILNILDRPHPYHLTVDQLLNPLKDSSFEVKYRKEEKGIGIPAKINTAKKVIANQMICTLWLWSQKTKPLA